MRIKSFAMAMSVVCGLLASCSDMEKNNEDPSIWGNNGEVSSISFRMSLPASEATRADGWQYMPGSDDENAVSNIRFYFFDDEGKGVNLRKHEAGAPYSCHYDVDLEEEDASGTQNPSIEKTINLTLKFNLEKEVYPTQVVAVLNPGDALTAAAISTLSDLQGAIRDYQTGLTSKGKFVMSNATYVEDGFSPKVVNAVALSNENFSTSSSSSEGTPVDIYVERVLARLDVKFSMDPDAGTSGNNIFKISDSLKKDGSAESQEVYVELLGWALTSTPKTSRLLKTVNSGWDATMFGNGYAWNIPSDHRSFWAINPPFSDSNYAEDYSWFTFNDIKGDASGNRAEGSYGISGTTLTAYMQENANPYSSEGAAADNPKYPTKALFAAQLVNSDGDPLDIAEYESKYYSLEGLKTFIANNLDIYRQAASGETADHLKGYVKIKPDDLDFETSKEHGKDLAPDSKGDYYVYVKLITSSEWYHYFSSEEEMAGKKISDPQGYINSVTFPAKVWKGGYTYYYFDVVHCPGYYGVVRNTYYRANVSEIRNLGTPVYNPGEIIYPETPEDTDNQLKVTVENLDWRDIDQDLQLAW
ncbi:MAG: Mfa1 fimbrilin C-terminal domain-containing protein [Muribaculaceae bacterium]|nr:Mfa1 fimbrilin C-terminal domain-containing protein [Muribaculaceae bacterium]